MTNKEHATKIIDILHSREFMKDADGYYDSIRDRENLIRLTQEYLDKNFPPDFSEVVSVSEPILIPTDRCIEEWFMFPNTIGDEGIFDECKFWQEAPYRTNGDVVEEIKTALKYFMTTWNRIKEAHK